MDIRERALLNRFKAIKLKGEGFVRKGEQFVQKGEHFVRKLAADVQIEDEARFLKSWFDNPLKTGAVSPSGKALARQMASYVDPASDGPIIELGPGTGPVTEALIARGIDERRIVAVEFNPDFCKLLRRRFPKATIIEGDAYDLATTLQGHVNEPAAAIISSLPLFTKPEALRLSLLDTAFGLMSPGAPFVQFTYAAVSPMPRKDKQGRPQRFEAKVSPRIWLNLPPACVWVYRRAQG